MAQPELISLAVSVILIPTHNMHRTDEILASFDHYLKARQLRFEGVVIGGAALNLLGVVSRLTKDCDILYPEIPGEITLAARDVARRVRAEGGTLFDDWLNNGPASLRTQLPTGWEKRTQSAFAGEALYLSSLGREDLLCAKLFALCDRAIDLGDCIALAPSKSEAAKILPWLEEQDANPDWPAHVRATIADLARRLGYAVP